MNLIKNTIWIMVLLWLAIELLEKAFEIGFWAMTVVFIIFSGVTLWVLTISAALKIVAKKDTTKTLDEIVRKPE